MKKFDELYAIATRKSQYDQTNTWFKGVETYLEAIGKEVDEVREEIRGSPLSFGRRVRRCVVELS